MKIAGVGVSMLGVSLLASITAVAQRPATQWDGVFTLDQARRGAELYVPKCANCHAGDLTGFGDDEARVPSPPLIGPPFEKSWEGFTLGDIFEKIQTSMPRDDPGSMTPQQYADVLAFMLARGRYPAGTTELPPSVEDLKRYKFTAKNPAASGQQD
jgi:cytochrome c